ncbi:hypothetical protein L249_1176 [Ophiocordyceps polyrhachis-furcata BCC 54312]|uniref:Uncharacterized protein n=1 Tax=Ophiocordyceps polyrhachis-furcata BCC 54312 TaxID=1330021 RepID=A0A367LFJ6_9HYPO|nr:hypothetical protein L249_1176 [Ophiocordyceps polyrhachis-furcata BCC 54312]
MPATTTKQRTQPVQAAAQPPQMKSHHHHLHEPGVAHDRHKVDVKLLVQSKPAAVDGREARVGSGGEAHEEGVDEAHVAGWVEDRDGQEGEDGDCCVFAFSPSAFCFFSFIAVPKRLGNLQRANAIMRASRKMKMTLCNNNLLSLLFVFTLQLCSKRPETES